MYSHISHSESPALNYLSVENMLWIY